MHICTQKKVTDLSLTKRPEIVFSIGYYYHEKEGPCKRLSLLLPSSSSSYHICDMYIKNAHA